MSSQGDYDLPEFNLKDMDIYIYLSTIELKIIMIKFQM